MIQFCRKNDSVLVGNYDGLENSVSDPLNCTEYFYLKLLEHSIYNTFAIGHISAYARQFNFILKILVVSQY